jgi:hypothetical protein
MWDKKSGFRQLEQSLNILCKSLSDTMQKREVLSSKFTPFLKRLSVHVPTYAVRTIVNLGIACYWGEIKHLSVHWITVGFILWQDWTFLSKIFQLSCTRDNFQYTAFVMCWAISVGMNFIDIQICGYDYFCGRLGGYLELPQLAWFLWSS